MTDFNDIWGELVEEAQEMHVVETFSRGNENDVKYDPQQNAICFNSRASSKDFWTEIPRESWEEAWNELRKEGELRPRQFWHTTDIQRGSTAVPFLQKALDLPVDTDERAIFPPDSR